MAIKNRAALTGLALLTSISLAVGCGSGGSGASKVSEGGQGFQLLSISVPEGTTDWRINAPILFTFSRTVDVGSLSGNTIAIQGVNAAPALGGFSFAKTATGEDRTRVIFQPTCPLETSPFPDAGLQPGGVEYEIIVRGGSEAGATVTSNGERLATAQRRRFSTPNSFAREDIFADTRPGPPQPVLQGEDGAEGSVTRLELLSETGDVQRIPFPANTLDCGTTDAGASLCSTPLNLYTGQGGAVSFVMEFDQAVDPSPENISSDRLRLEFLNELGNWGPLPANVELVANCTETGAAARLTPIGVLPPDSDLRLVVSPDFSDLRGQSNDLLPTTDFAFARTGSAGTAGFEPFEGTADEILETFGLPGEEPGSREDLATSLALPRADWGEGELRAGFDFNGTGGSGGDFDYTLRFGDDVFFDTVSQQVVNAQQTRTQIAIGGVLDVRNFTVEAGARLRVLGPNPLVVFATGEVRIDGVIDCSGFPAINVQSLKLANIPQQGGPGLASGGRGGAGSPVQTASSPQGQAGFGAFQTAGQGGQGGETGYTGSEDESAHHSGGGGGGVFGPAAGPLELLLAGDGTAAQRGFDGWDTTIFNSSDGIPGAIGAVTGNLMPLGGDAGPSPFRDVIAENDFFGTRFLPTGELVTGELPSIWYGSGGGGGGDSVSLGVFPTPDFVPGSTDDDRKGGAGGGGAGALHILAVGDIAFGASGQILIEGGDGGRAQNFAFNSTRPGGGGGGGSGGHLLLETNSRLDLSEVTGEIVSARGGLGAISTVCEDALFPYTGCATPFLAEFDAFGGRLISNGGAGGPGVVQVHLPGSDYSRQLDAIDFPAKGSEVLGDYMVPAPVVALPTFASRSVGLTEWLPLGGASAASGGGTEDLQFFFSEVLDATVDPLDETVAGRIRTDEFGAVLQDDELLAGTLGVEGISAEESRVEVLASSLAGTADDIYLRNPNLVENFGLDLTLGFSEASFVVSSASYDQASGLLSLTLEDENNVLTIFEGEETEYRLVPRFFRVSSEVAGVSVRDIIPPGARVSIQFQAVGITAEGSPDEDALLVDWTGDPTELNDPALSGANAPAFLRMRVTFDIDESGSGLGFAAPRPALEFLRLPFRF